MLAAAAAGTTTPTAPPLPATATPTPADQDPLPDSGWDPLALFGIGLGFIAVILLARTVRLKVVRR